MISLLFRISKRSISGPYAEVSLPGLIRMRAAISFVMLLAVVGMVCVGCGGGSVTTPPPAPQALSITTQPSTQGIRLGQAATFSVMVSGSNPITYKWNKNGGPISGATGPTYTTPATVAPDNDSIFNVTITNGAGSVTSGNARLLLNTPKSGDLRFQQVDAVATRDLYLGNIFTAIDGGIAITWGDYGSPFQLTPLAHCVTDGDPRNCSWFFSLFNSPEVGLTTSYQSGLLSDFQNDLSALSSNTVVTSMDIEPANNAYATSWVKSAPAGIFAPVNTQSVLPSDFQTIASQEAAVGHVITAVGFNAGMVMYVSYGWQSDTATVYETSVVTATLDTIPTQAASLAQQGYIITAVGGDTTNGFLLVGTRVQGDTMPRPFKVLTSPAQDVTDQLWGEGYALVTSIVNDNDTTVIWIGEK